MTVNDRWLSDSEPAAGDQKLGAKTVTSALRGLVRDDARTRQEFLALTTRSSYEQ